MDEEQPTPEPGPVDDAATNVAGADAGPASARRRRLRIAVALTLLAALVILAVVQATGLASIVRSPSTASTTPRIAVVDASGALTTMDDRGGDVVSHTVAEVGFQFPAWSPDGTRVAAIGQAADGGGVYVFQARGAGGSGPGTPATEPTLIYESPEQPPFYVYWTPDGKQVTFLTSEREGLALRVAPADASAPGSIIREGAPLYWDWIDPSRLLVHAGTTGPGSFLGEVGLDGVPGGLTVMAPGIFRSPVVSAGGGHHAFVASVTGVFGEGEAVIVESRDGSLRHEIPVHGISAFGFAPTGAILALIAPPENAPDVGLPIGPLRLVDAASGDVRSVLDAAVIAFFWAPDGRTIAALRIPAPDEEEVASVEGRPPRAGHHVPSVASEGAALRLTFIDVASGDVRSERSVRVAELFTLQLLPFFDQYNLSHRIWSPDSASIVLPLVADGKDRLVVIPADGSAERSIADGVLGFWSP
jgi:hypothetical protein